MGQTTAAKAWTAFVISAVGLLGVYGVHVTLPDATTLEAVVGLVTTLATGLGTYLIPNHPK
jgi:hypothetical protein